MVTEENATEPEGSDLEMEVSVVRCVWSVAVFNEAV
jgi:hypothetical protein